MSKSFEGAPFVPLHRVTVDAVRSFDRLLPQLSGSFKAKKPKERREEIAANLEAAVDAYPEVVVMVSKEGRRIVSSATGNLLPGNRGFVDDVVTDEIKRGQGYGREATASVHRAFIREGVEKSMLTSSNDRLQAGDLYAKMGYEEHLNGSIWRAPLNGDSPGAYEEFLAADSQALPHFATMHGYSPKPRVLEQLISSALDSSLSAVVSPAGRRGPVAAVAIDCLIPTGHKAWITPPSPAVGIRETIQAIEAAKSALHDSGATSANVYSFGPMPPQTTAALVRTGFKPRETRFYSLNLPK